MTATVDDVRSYVVALPEVTTTTSYGNEAWEVSGGKFAWVRPLSKADIRRMKPNGPPDGPIVAVSTIDLDDKAAILAANTPGFFDIEHFAGYPAYLIQLDVVAKRDLKRSLVDAWLAIAPEDLARAHLRSHR